MQRNNNSIFINKKINSITKIIASRLIYACTKKKSGDKFGIKVQNKIIRG